MDSIYILLVFTISFQTTQCAPPMDSSSSNSAYGSDFTNDFNKNMGMVISNLQNGVASITNPPLKFGLDTIPSLISYGIHKAADKASKLVSAKQEALGKVVTGVGHAVGGGGVLGSSLAGGTLQVLGHGIGAGTNIAHNAAVAGIDLAGNMADQVVAGTVMKGNITRAVLTALGDGLIAAGGGVTVVSQGLSNIIDAIGDRISQRIANIKETAAAVLGNKEGNIANNTINLSSNAQVKYYTLLNSYLQILVNVQNMFDGLASSINPDQTPTPLSEDKITSTSDIKPTSSSTS